MFLRNVIMIGATLLIGTNHHAFAAETGNIASVSFTCDSTDNANKKVHIAGLVTGPISQDWSSPKSADGRISIQVDGQQEELVSSNGILLGTRQYRDPDSGKWVYVPMRTFLQGHNKNGVAVSGGFYFGLGRESLMNVGSTSISLFCDFADTQPPQPSTTSPQPKPNCREECKWMGGGHDGPRLVCRKICDQDSQPQGGR